MKCVYHQSKETLKDRWKYGYTRPKYMRSTCLAYFLRSQTEKRADPPL